MAIIVPQTINRFYVEEIAISLLELIKLFMLAISILHHVKLIT